MSGACSCQGESGTAIGRTPCGNGPGGGCCVQNGVNPAPYLWRHTHMRKRLAVAALLLALGFSAYETFSHKAQVTVTDDGTLPPPSFP